MVCIVGMLLCKHFWRSRSAENDSNIFRVSPRSREQLTGVVCEHHGVVDDNVSNVSCSNDGKNNVASELEPLDFVIYTRETIKMFCGFPVMVVRAGRMLAAVAREIRYAGQRVGYLVADKRSTMIPEKIKTTESFMTAADQWWTST